MAFHNNPNPSTFDVKTEPTLNGPDLETVEAMLKITAHALDSTASSRDIVALTNRMNDLMDRRKALREEAEAAAPKPAVPGRPRAFIEGEPDDE